ncbi:MAG TPA: bifunctional transaldolase/phosoglucose isomerase [Caldilineae bacterium]|nr:bifunctional transaldolase/phosoglucose isomerase [Caldilineae bacterium]
MVQSRAALRKLEPAVQRRLEDAAHIVERIWARDASLWKDEPSHQKIIRNRLGWLDIAGKMRERVDELKALAHEVWSEGFRDVLLLGMGGSSLCVEVFRQVYGPQPNAPRLWVLDTTHPDTIRRLEKQIDLERTLFIVSSKAGTTTETRSFEAYFLDQVRKHRGEEAGRQFIAITDPDTPLAAFAREQHYRHLFLNPPDIGGRYSGLSYFGQVPAALAGIDIARMLDQAEVMIQACKPHVPAQENPGAWLGVIMGEAALAGRDKLTIIVPPQLASFGLWVEQLLAESTGKEGKGIVPIAGEEVGPPDVYGDDRLFVYLTVEGAHGLDDRVAALEEAGHPVVYLHMPGISWIGAEFYRWEIATAVAGAILGINPFDEPNVAESKENTRKALERYTAEGRLPEEEPALVANGVALYGQGVQADSWEEALRAHLRQARPGEYVAFMAYLDSAGLYEDTLQAIRLKVREALRVATTLGYGPRFLHSTGQLHKGGPDSGVFVQITDGAEDLPIPGKPYTFGTLIAAQALGDLQSLRARGRRVIRLHLKRDTTEGLERVLRAVEDLK